MTFTSTNKIRVSTHSSNQEYRNGDAFAVIKKGGSVVTWGNPYSGGIKAIPVPVPGYSSSTFSAYKTESYISYYLSSGVSQIFSTNSAFAALKENGSVITWGGKTSGGDSSDISQYLTSNVITLYSTYDSFAALKKDGRIITWGGNLPGKVHSINGVVDVYSSGYDSPFIALKESGGLEAFSSSENSIGIHAFNKVADKLERNVEKVFAGESGKFAAIKTDGSCVIWGRQGHYSTFNSIDNFTGVSELNSGVKSVHLSGYFKAVILKDDGTAIIWSRYGDGYSTIQDVEKIYSTENSLAFIKTDGSVERKKGDWLYGNDFDSDGLNEKLSTGVKEIYTNEYAFAALKEDGSVLTWGFSEYGGDSSEVSDQLASNVVRIFSSRMAFAALKSDGSVVTWGHENFGGDSSSVSTQIANNVSNIFAINNAFSALKNDGSVVTWGIDQTVSGTEIHPLGTKKVLPISEQLTDVISFSDPFREDQYTDENNDNSGADNEPNIFIIANESYSHQENKRLSSDNQNSTSITINSDKKGDWTIAGDDGHLFYIDPTDAEGPKDSRQIQIEVKRRVGQYGFDYENPLDKDKNNKYELVVGVSDTDGNITTKNITYIITDYDERIDDDQISASKYNDTRLISHNSWDVLSERGELQSGSNIFGRIDYPEDRDWYQFYAEKGVDYKFILEARNDDYYPLGFPLQNLDLKVASGKNSHSYSIYESNSSTNGKVEITYSNEFDRDTYITIDVGSSDNLSLGNFSLKALILNDGNSPEITAVNASLINENSIDFVPIKVSREVTWLLSGDDSSKFIIKKSATQDSNSSLLTYELSLISSPDYENPEDNNQDNIYKVKLTATDLYNNSSDHSLSLQVVNISEIESINGSSEDDQLIGSSEKDQITGFAGNDLIDGKSGIDTAIYLSEFSNYSFTRSTSSLEVADLRTGTNDGTDTLSNIEYIQFTDQTVEESKVDIVKTYSGEFSDYKFYSRNNGSKYEIKTSSGYDEITGYPLLRFTGEATTSSFRDVSAIVDIKGTFDQVTGLNTDDAKMFRLYNASFKRLPDADGLKYWIEKYSSGENDDRAVAQSFLISEEFKERYGANVTNAKYVETLYINVLGRDYDQEGYNYWLGNLNNGLETKYELLLGFAESAENKALFTDMTGFG